MLPELVEAILVDVVQSDRHSKLADRIALLDSLAHVLQNCPLGYPLSLTALPFHSRWLEGTHTLAAHLVTFLPSLIQSISPFPCASVLHFM